jgi:hypothetical protein
MKRTNRMPGGRPFHCAPLPVSARKIRLYRLYQRAAFRVKQESGFVFSERWVGFVARWMTCLCLTKHGQDKVCV